MASSNDDFGLSSSDEAELLELADKENGPNLKRKREDELPSKATKVHVRSKASPSPALKIATKVLRERFGLQAFRLKQEAAIARLLDGDSSVVVFPTGESTFCVSSDTADVP